MKFLVTGSAGLVGSQITKDLSYKNHTVYSCYNKSKPTHGTPIKLDIANFDDVKRIVSELKPDAIIHLAAMTDVDECEAQQGLAITVNAKATEILAKHAAKQNSFFVYLSTDYVFDGKNGMRKEDDVPNPLGFYGKSKYKGELALNKMASSYAIARTSTPFGLHKTKKTFPIWVRESLESGKEIPVLVDQFTSPTFVPNLSEMLIEIATRQFVGTIHTAGATRISRYSLAETIAERLHLDKKLLRPVSLSEMSWRAQRPKDSSLDVSWAKELLNAKPQTIQQSLDLLFS